MNFFQSLIGGGGRKIMPSTAQGGAQPVGLPIPQTARARLTLTDVLRMRGGNRTTASSRPAMTGGSPMAPVQNQSTGTLAQFLQNRQAVPQVSNETGYLPTPQVSNETGYLPTAQAQPPQQDLSKVPEALRTIIEGIPQANLPGYEGMQNMLYNMATPGSGTSMGQLAQILREIQANSLRLAKQGRFE